MKKEYLYDAYVGLVMRFYRPKNGGINDFFKKRKFREKLELASKCKEELDRNIIGPNTIKVFNDCKHIVIDLLPCECDPYFKIYECPKHLLTRFIVWFENSYIGVENDLFKDIE